MKMRLEKADRAILRDYILRANPDMINDPEGISECVDVLANISAWGRDMKTKGFLQGAVAASVGAGMIVAWHHLKPKIHKNQEK